jgi:sodium/proline symporter
MVKALFPQFIAGFILCAVIAAAINVMSAQVLVSASIIAEDFYKKSLSIKDDFVAKKVAIVSRISVVVLCIVASVIAFYCQDKKIYDLVWYPWTGLGCTFGPVLLVSLYSKITNRYAALAGIIVGGTTAGLWPLFNQSSAMIVGFCASLVAMFLVNRFFNRK